MSAAIALQKAIFAALSGDAALAASVGGARIYDHVPANAAFPYITFGRLSRSDWSTASEDGAEHMFTLHVWSKARGKSQAAAIMERVRVLLHDADLADIRFDDDHDVYRGAMRFRAVTEPAG
jgi:hypothetical protein